MSLCRDEWSTIKTESNDKSVDSFQVAIRCAQTKTFSWLKQSKKNCKFFEAHFSRAAGCGSYPSYSYPAGSSKAKKNRKIFEALAELWILSKLFDVSHHNWSCDNSLPVVKNCRYHPSHMSFCRDERSTTETESNDKSRWLKQSKKIANFSEALASELRLQSNLKVIWVCVCHN